MMKAKENKPRLSKGILEMKFMQRTKAKVEKEIEEAEGRAMYSNEISSRMLASNSNFVMEPSYVYCEDLIEGRLSFRGMNPEIERILELEQEEKNAAKTHEQPKDISDKDMAILYHKNMAPSASKTMKRKFQKGTKKRASDTQRMEETMNKVKKFLKPSDE